MKTYYDLFMELFSLHKQLEAEGRYEEAEEVNKQMCGMLMNSLIGLARSGKYDDEEDLDI